MKILYIGNKLSRYGKTPTSVETLGIQLTEICYVITVSDKNLVHSFLYGLLFLHSSLILYGLHPAAQLSL